MYAGASRLSDVEFLIRSTNRLDVISRLQDGPRNREALRAETDFSRVTLSRILGDLTDRGWVTRRDGRYEITPEGDVVGREVRRLFANLEAVNHLDTTLSWLPVERFDFELERLADAKVIRPVEHDLTGQVRWVRRRIQGADRIRSVGTWVAGEILETIAELTDDTGCEFEGVVEGHVLEHIKTDPDLRPMAAQLLASERANLYRYEGSDADITMSILPDGVLLCGQTAAGSSTEAVATTDDAVRAWALERFRRLRAEAIPLERSSFTP